MIQARERDRRALELRMEGLTFDAIAAEMGVTREAVRKAVARSLEETKAAIAERADELRAVEMERLEKITEVLWPRVLEGDLRAIDRVLRTRESFRRLTGIDLQSEEAHEGPTFQIIDARLPWQRGDVIDGQVVGLPASTEATD